MRDNVHGTKGGFLSPFQQQCWTETCVNIWEFGSDRQKIAVVVNFYAIGRIYIGYRCSEFQGLVQNGQCLFFLTIDMLLVVSLV